MTVRFQGIDAPELHFPPLTKRKGPERETGQSTGNSKVSHRRQSVTRSEPKILLYQVVTRIDEPADAFDVYARLIGDVLVGSGAKQVNLNRRLAENGWALPAHGRDVY